MRIRSFLFAVVAPGLALACGGSGSDGGATPVPAKEAEAGGPAVTPPDGGASDAETGAPGPTKPSLLSFTPGGAACVSVDQAIVATFSRRMDRASTEAAFSIVPAVPGTLSWSADSTTMTFKPNAVLSRKTAFTIAITDSARDSDDHPLRVADRTAALAKQTFTTVGDAARGSLDCLASFMAGSLDDEREYWKQIEGKAPSSDIVKRIRLRQSRVWPAGVPGTDGQWLYVEQATTYGDTRKDENPPYRQRLYRLHQTGLATFDSDVYGFRDRPLAASGTDFETQILAKLTSTADRWLFDEVYAKEPNGSYILVGYSFDFYRSLKIIVGITPAPPGRILATDFSTSILDKITPAVLNAANDSKYQTGSLSVADAQALVSSMYPADPTDAAYRIPRGQVEALNHQRVRDVLNAIGFNSGHNHDPLDFTGAWEKPNPLADLTVADFELKTGCSVHLQWDAGKQTYSGKTTDDGCLTTAQGASYLTTEVALSEAGMVSWDRGFNAAHVQVFGGNERYEFQKVGLFGAP